MNGRTELCRFLLIGGINFIFTFFVFSVALKILHLNHLLALLLAWITGNILTYVLNFVWVFRPEARFSFGVRFLKYLSAGSVSISVNLLTLYVLVNLYRFDPFWSQVAIMPVILLFNFTTAKFWSLRKSGRQP